MTPSYQVRSDRVTDWVFGIIVVVMIAVGCWTVWSLFEYVCLTVH